MYCPQSQISQPALESFLLKPWLVQGPGFETQFGTMEASSWDSPLSGVSQTKMDKKRLVYGEESQPRAPTALV